MSGNRIRLRYSGLLVFSFKIISIGTGLLFTLMITRSVSPEEYGIYGNLGDVLSYFTLTSTIIPFWVTRFVARSWPGSFKTGFAINTLMGLTSAALYLLLLPGIMRALGVGPDHMPIYLVAAISIFNGHTLAVLEATLYPKRPEKIGFGLLIFEVSKVVSGFVLIVNLKMGLMGALMATIIASLSQFLFYLRYLVRGFMEAISWAYAREWFKASILNVYSLVGGRLLAFANILLFVYGGEISRAYYGAASAIASIVAYSSSLSFALYPKLLSGAEPADIRLSLKMVLMFAIPMSIGAIILSRDLLLILNPLYGAAALILIVLSINALFASISSPLESIIMGIERFDAEAKISYKRAFRSKLFLMLSLQYVQAAMVVPLIYVVLSSLPLDALSSALYFAVISTIGGTALTTAKYLIAKSCINFSMPWSYAGKCLLASLAMASGLLILQAPPKLIVVLAKALAGAIIYFALLLFIDRESREIGKLVKSGVARAFNTVRRP